jgi:hypothetical protein
LIHRAPDWRVPIAVIGSVVLLVLAAFAIALINLSSEANRSATVAAAPVTSTVSSPTTPAATSATPAPSRSETSGWPPGLPGWTVALGSAKSRGAAQAIAGPLAAAGIPVGILDSSQHPAMRPGRWVVFSGRYPTRPAARAQAALLSAKGHRARVRLVARPGGT